MTARRLVLVSAALFVASWCVPVAFNRGELIRGPVYGWQAFLFGISPVFGIAIDGGFFIGAWMVIGSLSNALLPVVWYRAWRGATKRAHALAWTATTIAMLNSGWMMLPDAAKDLRVGYYLWIAAFWLGAGAALRVAYARTAQPVA